MPPEVLLRDESST
jgi:calcium-dependent protein kinase